MKGHKKVREGGWVHCSCGWRAPCEPNDRPGAWAYDEHVISMQREAAQAAHLEAGGTMYDLPSEIATNDGIRAAHTAKAGNS